MKLKFLLLLICCKAANTLAQPTTAQVVNRLTHNGVYKVNVVKIVKEWHKSKYIYTAYADVYKTVAPEKVLGVKGISLVIPTMALYDLGAKEPYSVLGSESNGEYIGINLPMPNNQELSKYATEAARISPEKFFLQAYDIILIDTIICNNPNPKWLHPGKLAFEAKIVYVQKLQANSYQKVQANCTIELHRNAIEAPWFVGKAKTDGNQQEYVGDIIMNRKDWEQMESISIRAANKVASTNNIQQNDNSATIQQHDNYAVGDKVLVEENGKWYPSTVLKSNNDKWFIHYEGYSSKYDLWVGADRIKKQ